MSTGGPFRTPAGMMRRLVASRKPWHLPASGAALSVLLALPALGAGWILDDYYHRTILLGRSRLRDELGPPAEMFRFFRGDPARTRRLVDIGLFPWWTDPSLKAEFLQALSVLTHRLDYALWPDSPPLMHAQSLLWLGAAAAAAAAYYRRMFGARGVAAVAAFLFAADDARGATVGFLANRNVLVAATFGISALIAHDRDRRGGSRVGRLLAPLLLLAALSSKEEGIGTCAYLASYALFVDPRGIRRGVLALGPCFAAVVAWASLRAYWGYGVRDMGLYIDPLADPSRFLSALPGRMLVLLLGQWSPVPADLGTLLQPARFAALACLAAAFLAVLLVAMAPLLRRDRLSRFWAAGMLLATIPVSATLPMDRLLTFVGLGASGLLARFWQSAFAADGPPPGPRRGRLVEGVAWFLVAVHAILAPLILPARAANPLGPAWIERRLYVPTSMALGPEDRAVVIVNAPSPVHAGYLALRRELDGVDSSAPVRVLAPAIPSVRIRRLDDRTLAVRPRGGYLRWPLDRAFRSERRAFRAGDEVKLTGMTVAIRSVTPDGRPEEASFRFDVPLESRSLLWLCFREGRFEPFTPPAVGQGVEIDFRWNRSLLSPRRGAGYDEGLPPGPAARKAR
ncbi:hypothetical protein OJF2_32130 [Aquisphaera giovannonii]|uniref:Glycosyltransferase RgtA/B/C/D-like domain-containing protein n=1 Tax=Aquisphaera giovannonii TaxID=406548 RepID=A0A5B9W1Y7_9BACT|nr:hypothetical protein [Aquisphaera giovannonii]QEH34672.1 hypothetical protein OJF2_32130 [Aquisphaera giovannonii]